MNLSLILFNLNFLLPLMFVGMLLLATALFHKMHLKSKRFYRLISINYHRIATGRSINRITDKSLTYYFCTLLFAKLCIRVLIVFMYHS